MLIKDDLQSLLRTIVSLVKSSVLFQGVHRKMWTFRNYLHEVNSNFYFNRNYGCEALFFVLSHIMKQFGNFKSRWSCWKRLTGFSQYELGIILSWVISQKLKLAMNFFETFPECSLPSTASKNTNDTMLT